ncbi:MAG: hypothetical protein ABSA52_09730 [Candidatus Binatia bacterium]|jgi:hypothetical protein
MRLATVPNLTISPAMRVIMAETPRPARISARVCSLAPLHSCTPKFGQSLQIDCNSAAPRAHSMSSDKAKIASASSSLLNEGEADNL